VLGSTIISIGKIQGLAPRELFQGVSGAIFFDEAFTARVHRKFHRTSSGGNIPLEASAKKSIFKSNLNL